MPLCIDWCQIYGYRMFLGVFVVIKVEKCQKLALTCQHISRCKIGWCRLFFTGLLICCRQTPGLGLLQKKLSLLALCRRNERKCVRAAFADECKFVKRAFIACSPGRNWRCFAYQLKAHSILNRMSCFASRSVGSLQSSGCKIAHLSQTSVLATFSEVGSGKWP